MTEFYTLVYAQRCKTDLKRERNTIGIAIVVLICAAVAAIALRNPENHIPALAAVCLIWICGVWFLMFRIMEKVMPLKRDMAFWQVMMNSNKKELEGEVVACEEKITMRRIPCYNLKILVGDKENSMREIYIDRRFVSKKLKEGSRVRLLVAQRFVFALETGGTKDD